MIFRQLILIPLMFFILLPCYGGLPSNEKLNALKQKVDKELSKYFQIQNSWGKCLQVVNSQTQMQGGVVQVSSCNTGAHQKWKLVAGKIQLSSGKCLQTKGDPAVSGTRIEITDCNNSAAQNWHYEQGLLKSSANTCLEILPTETNKEGGIVQIAVCNGERHQQWKPL